MADVCWDRAALATAIRMGLCALLSSAFQISPVDVPYFLSSDHNTWIFITALVVGSAAGDSCGQAIVRSLDRTLGTVLGALVGLVLAGITQALSLHDRAGLHRWFVIIGLTLLTASIFYLVASSKREWVKFHYYMFVLFPITLGMVWLAPGAEDAFNVSQYRCCATMLGAAIAMVALFISHPGCTLYVVHKQIGTGLHKAADLVDLVCKARINQQPQRTLKHFHEAEFDDAADDDIRKTYRGIASLLSKMRNLLAFSRWEPKCFYPSNLAWLPHKAPLRYRLLLARLTHLNATAMALNVQVRVLNDLPTVDSRIVAAAENLAQQVAEILRHAAKRMDAKLSSQEQEHGTEDQDALMRVLSTSMENLSQAAQGGSLQMQSTGRLQPDITRILGAGAEECYEAWSGPAFVLLMLQLALHATMILDDVIKFMDGNQSDDTEDAGWHEQDSDEDDSQHSDDMV